MLKINNYIHLIGAPLILSACATTVPMDEGAANVQHVISKNFEVGVEATANVGEPLMEVKDYYVSTSSRRAWRADSAFSYRPAYIPMESHAPPGEYGISSRKVIGETAYDLIHVNNAPLLIASDGRVAKVMNNVELSAADLKISPPDFRMTPIEPKRVDTSRGYQNFQLIYTGLSGSTIRITYREYSPDDLARTAFFQDLTYDKDQHVVHFKNIVLEIESADNQSVRYKVLSLPKEMQ